MSPGRPPQEDQPSKPVCPQCGSDDTALIRQEPVPAGSAPAGAEASKVKEPPRYRCLTCRYKWKEGEGD